MDLQTPIAKAGRMHKIYASRLEKLGIIKLEDFLYHIPSRYEDYSLISKISRVQPGETVSIQGTVIDIKNEFTKSWKKLQKARIADTTGGIDVIWFNQPYLTRVIQKGDILSLSGKIDWFLHKMVMQSPEYETVSNKSPLIHTGRLVPVYPETRGVSSKWIRRQVYTLLEGYKDFLTEYLPEDIRIQNNMPEFLDSLQQIHFPINLENAQKARKRLAFDELFITQLASLQRRKAWEKNLTGIAFSITPHQKYIDTFVKTLPFTLTNAQQKAIEDICNDLALTKPMNRLLEGDVGSGKTVVGATAMYLAYLNGLQSVLMAPTEILANQHYATITQLLSPLGVKVAIATGSKKSIKYKAVSSKGKKSKETLDTKYIIHNTDILVGTHAVLSEKINFEKLGLVIIDEQQRFGVAQRGIIRQKGNNPHVLTMTATPIPRTIALTLYGDLDLSILNEMPVGRKKIKTWLVQEEKRESAYKWIEKQITEQGDQAFIICPFIEESESMQTIKAASKEFEHLQKNVFPHLKIGLLHGKLKGKEKNEVLKDFKEKKYDILVATPVVEVGIDVPNATVILIEASERFGLAQLHQLRGRVGRGDKQSYCLLFTESKNPQTLQRLKAMETMHSGAELAELDLRLRGPGDMYGTKQHGQVLLKIASFSDFELIEKTRKEAEKILPGIEKYPKLQEKLQQITTKEVSPD